MDWKPISAVFFTLGFGLLLTQSSLIAQRLPPGFDPPNPIGTPGQTGSPSIDDPDDQPQFPQPHTQMEQQQEQQQQSELNNWLVPQVQQPPDPPAGQSTVSVTQLEHPLSRKGRGLLEKVESYFKHGQRAKAKKELAAAFKEPSAAPYAHAILGTEYLKEGNPEAAIPELEGAARVLSVAGIHSNLGYAFCITGQEKQGLQQLEEALRIDGTSVHARFLLGVLLLNQKSREEEAGRDLKMAQSGLHSAHLALAVYHLRRGEKDAAEEQVHEYLGPNRASEFPEIWKWACAAAERQHPATAFGFKDAKSD